MTYQNAWGLGLATITDSGETLDVWYPDPQLGVRPTVIDPELLANISSLEGTDPARRVSTALVQANIELGSPPTSAADAYLRLHLLSHRLVKPNSINLDGLYTCLSTVVWTSAGPCAVEGFEQTRLRLRAKLGAGLTINGVDRIPRMVDYVMPSDVRIADADRVRLGAYLAPGTVVMHEGFVNYNAGTLGRSMVEGRIQQGVVVGAGSDIGGGASLIGAISGGGKLRVSLGERCLLGANSGVGIPLGDNCVIEAGLYITAGTKIAFIERGGIVPGEHGRFEEPPIVTARQLAGQSNLLFRRNSVNGRVEALPHPD